MAEEVGLDLVEISAKSDPPVCKIMDFGKYKYEMQKKARAAKKNQVVVELKEIQIRPKTETHDLQHKAKSCLGFLADANKCKLIVFYRRFELNRIEVGWETMTEFVEHLQDKAILETPPKFEGRRLACIFGPIPAGKKLEEGHLLKSFPKFKKPKNVEIPPPFKRRR